MTHVESIKKHLAFIYKDKVDEAYYTKFFAVLERYKRVATVGNLWDEKDVFLITYGDTIKREGEKPIRTLHNFVRQKLKNAISIVHILPFFPYSSDDGFSVIDFNKVDPALGSWDEIKDLTSDFKMMADLVVNHISAKSDWMLEFKNGEVPGKNYILTVDDDFDTSQVVRPRSSPLLTEFNTSEGNKKVWTTFSNDQIDLDYRNPDLMLAMIEILLTYIEKGISVIRLDAIAFLWKRSGTSCLHEPETHEAVKLMRDVFDYVVPGSILLTETNVPHKENISYFGIGDEAHMVYQFALPPLLLHALHTGNAEYLTRWAATLDNPGKDRTYFNFTASHDGIGVRPLEGLLPDHEKIALFDKMEEFGGRINTRRTVDGKDVPYELNITYYDALGGTQGGLDEWQTQRFICSQVIMMTLQGIPAIYLHSLLGTHNYQEGVALTGQNRTINRKKWDLNEITGLLSDDTDHATVFNELTRILAIRRSQLALNPDAHQEIMDAGKKFFIVYRKNKATGDELLSVTNMTHQKQGVSIPELKFKNLTSDLLSLHDMNTKSLSLLPYQTVWLTESMGCV